MSDTLTPRTDAVLKELSTMKIRYNAWSDASFISEYARQLERELAEIQRTLNSAVAARIELAKDNLYLLKQLESIGTTDCMGVAGMTMRQAYKIAALHSLAKRLQNGNSYTADDIAATCGELADAMTWEDKEVNK